MHVRVTGSSTCVHVNLLSCCIHCLDHSIRCHYSWMWELSLSPLSISLSSGIPSSPLSSSPPHPSLLSLSLSLSLSVVLRPPSLPFYLPVYLSSSRPHSPSSNSVSLHMSLSCCTLLHVSVRNSARHSDLSWMNYELRIHTFTTYCNATRKCRRCCTY